jgi:hypothetical protein
MPDEDTSWMSGPLGDWEAALEAHYPLMRIRRLIRGKRGKRRRADWRQVTREVLAYADKEGVSLKAACGFVPVSYSQFRIWLQDYKKPGIYRH